MEIIPVIDLMGGGAVQARAGNRAHYQPLQSVISRHVAPLSLIEDLLHFFPFRRLYIADLDAIMIGNKAMAFYQLLAQQFPQLEIWLDCGIRLLTEVEEMLSLPNIHCIIGSETLQELQGLATIRQQARVILSLDYRDGGMLGDKRLAEASELWPERVIAMNLDCVGQACGPDYALIGQLQRKWKGNVIAAGGIRDTQDLQQLNAVGIKQVLVASALHTGQLTAAILRDCLGWSHLNH